jgi:hypothetical protein
MRAANAAKNRMNFDAKFIKLAADHVEPVARRLMKNQRRLIDETLVGTCICVRDKFSWWDPRAP